LLIPDSRLRVIQAVVITTVIQTIKPFSIIIIITTHLITANSSKLANNDLNLTQQLSEDALFDHEFDSLRREGTTSAASDPFQSAPFPVNSPKNSNH
jgi:hypothetical protein